MQKLKGATLFLSCMFTGSGVKCKGLRAFLSANKLSVSLLLLVQVNSYCCRSAVQRAGLTLYLV